MKFQELKYKRPDMDAVCKEFGNLARRIEDSDNASIQLSVFTEYERMLSQVITMLLLGQLHYFLNTGDPFYAKEMEYINTVSPQFELAMCNVGRAMLHSPFRTELEEKLGCCYFKMLAVKCSNINDSVVDLMAEEQALCQRYEMLVSSAVVTFNGKEYPVKSMDEFYYSIDRDIRRQAMRTVNAWYENHSDELDEIFNKLVKNRTEQAHRLGYKNYTDMKYSVRIGYGRDELEQFRKNVLRDWVPVVSAIKDAQRQRLGLNTFRMYDSPLRFADGNPKLCKKGSDFVESVNFLFHKLSQETGAYFDLLKQNNMLDLFDRKGKIAYDAFCIDLPDYEMQFICGHFCGEQTDLENLVHEFGHAFASKRANERHRISLRDAGQEISETHSMTMELITAPYYHLFFSKKDTQKYMQKQLEYAAYFISAICVGDEFQKEIYDTPEMTPGERNAVYERIYKKYNPYIDYSNLPFDSWGAMWQDAVVIYSNPFYFIDYALAQTLALQFYAESLKDFGSAWQRYLKFIDCAGTLSFPDIITYCGLNSPFNDDCFSLLAKIIGQ